MFLILNNKISIIPKGIQCITEDAQETLVPLHSPGRVCQCTRYEEFDCMALEQSLSYAFCDIC